MARPALATLDDLSVLLDQEITDAEQAEARLAQASEVVRAYAREDWLDDDGELEDVPEPISGVVAQMVERASRNPAGVVSEAAGPFSRSFGPDAALRIWMTPDEKMIVRSVMGRTAIGTLATSRGPLETPGVVRVGYWPEETRAGLHVLMGDV